MDYSDDLPTAAAYLKLAVPKMVERKQPANPINYSLWYNYVAETLPELNRELDAACQSETGLDALKSKQLYLQHVMKLDVETQQQGMDQLTHLTGQLLMQLSHSAAGSNEFDNQLKQQVGDLHNSSSLQDLNDRLHEILRSTESISAANRAFQKQLNEAGQELKHLKAELLLAQKQAFTDPLTQLLNRKAFDQYLDDALMSPDAGACQLILMDVDHFKSFNDNYGHVIGDRVLQKIGAIAQESCPEGVIPTRFGGEEFAIILPESTQAEAEQLAENLRSRLRQLRVKVKQSQEVLDNISASFGVAQYKPEEGKESFIARADKALYSAKQQGRNRVVLAES